MLFDELQAQLNKFNQFASQIENTFNKITAAANRAAAATREVANTANLNKIHSDLVGVNKQFVVTNKTLSVTDTRLENAERSMEDFNHESKGMRDYNELVKRGITQTDRLEKALSEVTAELKQQGELMRRMAKYQDELYEQRRRRAAKQMRDSSGRFARMNAPDAPATGRGALLGGAVAGRASRGVGGAPLVAGYAGAHAIRGALSNAFALNQILTTIKAEGATEQQVKGARQTILDVSGQTRFTAKDVGTYILNSMRAGFDVQETTQALPTISDLGIAEDKSLEDAGRLLSEAAQALERPLSQMRSYAEQVTRATSMSPLRPELIEFINQRALSSFRIAGGSETDLLAILAELRKTVSSGRLLGTALKSIPADLNAVTQGRGTRRKKDAWERITQDYGMETQGKDFLQIFHDIGQVALKHDKSLILDLFGDEAGLRIQQLITEKKLGNILENRIQLLGAEGELQRKGDIQRESALNTWLRLLSSITTAGISLVSAIGGKKMENFNSLMESSISLVERFTRYVNQNRERIAAPFRRLSEWVESNRDSFAAFFKSFLDTVKPIVGALVAMTKSVAKLITKFPKLAGVLAASFVAWKLLGGHISKAALGMQSFLSLLRGKMPAGGLTGMLTGAKESLEGTGRRQKIRKAGGVLHKTGRYSTGALSSAGGIAAEEALSNRRYRGKISRKPHIFDKIGMFRTELRGSAGTAARNRVGGTAARIGSGLARGGGALGRSGLGQGLIGVASKLAPLLTLLKGIAAPAGGIISTLGLPLIAAIVAVTAVLVGLGALVVRNWEKIKGLFEAMGSFFTALFDFIGGWISHFLAPATSAVGDFLGGFKSAFDGIWQGLEQIGGWIENVFIAGLEKATGLLDSMTGWLRKNEAPAVTQRRTQEEANALLKGESFTNQRDRIKESLLAYKEKAGVSDQGYQQSVQAYRGLTDERAKIMAGESTIKTPEGVARFSKNFDVFESELKTAVENLPEKTKQPLVAPAMETAAAMPPMPQSHGFDRVDPTSTEFVDFSSVADLETALESGFTTLANINSGILDALIRKPIQMDKPSEVFAPGVPDLSNAEQTATDATENVQHITITINGTDKDPQAIAQEVIRELDREQRTNQFGH